MLVPDLIKSAMITTKIIRVIAKLTLESSAARSFCADLLVYTANIVPVNPMWIIEKKSIVIIPCLRNDIIISPIFKQYRSKQLA